jgi:hypothetical protein
MRKLVVIFLLCTFPCVAQSDSRWVLYSSTLSYHISHRLHEVDGVSHSALDKGVWRMPSRTMRFPDCCTGQIL